MIESKIDIDGNVIIPKKQKKRKVKDPLDDRKQYTTFFNYQRFLRRSWLRLQSLSLQPLGKKLLWLKR